MVTNATHPSAEAPALEELQRRAARARDEALAAMDDCGHGLAVLRRTMQESLALYKEARGEPGPAARALDGVVRA